ncbi:MAG: hypothetical protein KAT48_14315 [Bacteroidales bacterium]|nr:hypothetical protein [Bacteroidales bacterium]
MKKIISFFVLLLAGVSLLGQNLHQAEAFELNTPPPVGSNIYEASQYVLLDPGFEYAPTGINYFEAHINPFLVFPPEGGEFGGPNPGDEGVVGVLPGALNISGTGAATYSIPIDVPPGLNGIQPNISLVYNSQGGNGYLGVGWSLAGLSAISRTGTTIYNDGYVDGIDFDDNDKFALDGNRLIAINGEYGANGTEYRTEIETFSKIISYVDNGVLTKFEVLTKDGMKIEYGYTEDSRVEAEGRSDVLIWRINNMTDRRTGNYIEYIYDEFTNSGETRIKEIIYTKNDINTNLIVNKVKFVYTSDRDDPQLKYISGSKFQQTVLLDKIECIYNVTDIYRKYDLIYDPNEDFYSHLSDIELIGSNGDNINPTKFEWGINDHDYYEEELQYNYVNTDKFFTDFNGDGKSDMIEVYWSRDANNNKVYSDWKYRKRMQDGFSNQLSFTEPINQYFYTILQGGDFNGDGYQDLLRLVYTTSERDEIKVDLLMLGKPDGYDFKFLNDITAEVANKPEFKVGDFDGNGIVELLIAYKDEDLDEDNIFVWQFKDISPYYDVVYWGRFWFGDDLEKAKVIASDFTGDGKTNLLFTREYSGSINTCYIYEINLNSSDLIVVYYTGYPTIWHRILVSDFNNDGISDILTYNYSSENPQWEISCFNGKDQWIPFSNVPPLSLVDPFNPVNQFWFGVNIADLNGDGNQDIIQFEKQPNNNMANFNIYYNNGTSFCDESEGEIICYGGLNFYGGHYDIINTFNNLDFNGDGKEDVYCKRGFYDDGINYFNTNNKVNFVESISDGFGNATELYYSPLTDNNIYTKHSDAIFPAVDIQSPLFVVSKVENSLGQYCSKFYKYEGAKVHVQGKGFLGFSKTTIRDIQNQTEQISNFSYHPTYYYNYRTSQTIQTLGGQTLSESHFLNLVEPYDQLRIFPYVKSTLTKSYETDGSLINCVKKDIDYDNLDYGLVGSVKTMFDDELRVMNDDDDQYNFWQIEEYDYYPPDVANHVVNIIKDKYSTISQSGHTIDDKYSTTTHFDYYSYTSDNYPLLWKEIIEPGTSDIKTLEAIYEYDDYGNITNITTNAPNDNDYGPRVINFAYSEDYGHRFKTKKYNTVNNNLFEEIYTYDPVTGNNLTYENINGLITQYEYKGFGNVIKETSPDNVQTVNVMRWVDTPIPDLPDALYYSWAKFSGNAASKIYYDKFGNKLRGVTKGKTGQQSYDDVCVDYTFDSRNRLDVQTMPYYSSSPCASCTTKYHYDIINRINYVDHPDGTQTNYTYNGLSKTVQHANQSTTKISNTIGWPVSSEDSDGNMVNYSYEQGGLLVKTNINNIPETEVQVLKDKFGDRISLSDPNFKIINYTYNAFGELIESIDAKGTTTTSVYDDLGRLTTKTIGSEAINYTYDTEANGLGKPDDVSGYGHTTSYKYDDLGRIYQKTESIPGEGDYTFKFEFDALSRISALEYPSGFSIMNYYNQLGGLNKVYNKNDHSLLWEKKAEGPDGMTTEFELAQGNINSVYSFNEKTRLIESIITNNGALQDLDYTWYNDGIHNGNLQYRYKHKGDPDNELNDEFLYDNLNRLTTVKLNGVTTQSIVYDTQGLGNIVRKSGVSTGSDILYGPDGGDEDAGLHALTQIPDPDPDFDGSPQDIDYTLFDKVSHIEQGALTLDIYYGNDLQRVKQVFYNNLEMVEKKLYISGLYEETEDGEGNITKLHYLAGNDGMFGIHVVDNINGESTYYVLKDHLGSYNVITDENGIKLAEGGELSFDAWGERRNPDNWTNSGVPATNLFDRGFTGHEHLDDLGLINMNGRVYDNSLGRFLSPDPYVQMPDFPQNFNRYSYCLNNPLIYTDPSGEIVWFVPIIVGAAIGGYSGWKIGEAAGAKGWAMVGYIAGGAAIGGFSGFAGASIAASGGFMANTMGLIAGSYAHSVGMASLSSTANINSNIGFSFGVGSYNISEDELGGLWNWSNNTTMENIGYTFGALANLQDVNQLINSTQATLYTQKKDILSHSAVTKRNNPNDVLMSFGPNDNKGGNLLKYSIGFRKSQSYYHVYDDLPVDIIVNKYTLSAMRGLGKVLPFQGITTNCVNMSSLSLWLNGIPNIGIHPYLLYATTWAYSSGIRADLFSYYLLNQ